MDPLSAVAYALQVLELAPRVVAAGRDLSAYVTNASAVINKAQADQTAIPAAAWDSLKVIREALQSELHKP